MERKLKSRLAILVVAWASLSLVGPAQEFFTQTFEVGASLAATAVALDSTGVYVCLAGLSSGAGDWDYLLPRRLGTGASLTKFSFEGAAVWTRSLGPAELFVCEVAVGGERVYLLTNRSAELGELELYAFGSGGEPLWDKPIEWASSISADADGVYVGGGENTGGFLHRYGLSGERVWSQNFPEYRVQSIAGDADGVYSGGISLVSIAGAVVQRRSRDGAELWTRRFEDGGPASHIVTDGAVVYSVRGWGAPAFVDKLDAQGSLLWSRSNGLVEAAVYDAAADSTGLYLAGYSTGALRDSCRSGSSDGFVLKFSAEGTLRWSRQFSTSGLFTYFNDIALGDSDIYIAGQWSSALLARINKSQAETPENGPWIHPGCVVNAANYRGGQIAPREIVSIFGREIGPPEGVAVELTEGQLPTAAANVQIYFNDVAAPLLYVSDSQINAIVPDSISIDDSVNVQVEHAGVRSNVVNMPVRVGAPGLFSAAATASGPLLAMNADGAWNSATNRAERGSTVTLFATGLGLSGKVKAAFCCYSDQVSGVDALAVTTSLLPGLLQVRIKIPERLAIDAQWGGPDGEAPVALEVGDSTSGYDGFIYVRDLSLN